MGGRNKALRPLTKGNGDYLPESTEQDAKQKDRNIAILNEENPDGSKISKIDGNNVLAMSQ